MAINTPVPGYETLNAGHIDAEWPASAPAIWYYTIPFATDIPFRGVGDYALAILANGVPAGRVTLPIFFSDEV